VATIVAALPVSIGPPRVGAAEKFSSSEYLSPVAKAQSPLYLPAGL
jgi:hypothetical protein